ncbi:MAG: phosphatase PAP2 family protein [Thermoleophilia bacterium]|nr:phosphatase PAP2 family protein [Thermoleophilia bacterium]
MAVTSDPSEAALTYVALIVATLVAATLGWLVMARLPHVLSPGALGRLLEPARRSLGRISGHHVRSDQAALTLIVVAAVGAVVGGAVVAVMWLAVRRWEWVRELDGAVNRWGADHDTATSDRILHHITDLADTRDTVIVGVIVGVIELARRRNWWVAAYLLIVPFGATAINTSIKYAADRARPVLNPEAATLGPSFPSGHSATAAAFYAACALVLARGSSPRAVRALAGAAAGVAVAVASTRVLLGVHWVSDVVAGLSVGWTWWALVSIAMGRWLLRTPAHRHAPAVVPKDAAP